MHRLPDTIFPADFERDCAGPGPLHEALLDAASALARMHRLAGELTYLPGGANFVVAVGPWNVIKIFPPFQHFQWEAESRVLNTLIDLTLPVPIPQFRNAGELGAWGYVVMSRMSGTLLETVWERLDEPTRCRLLGEIGALMRSLHDLPARLHPGLDPPWELFWDHQRARCLEHQRRLGLPAQLLADLPAWLDRHVPELAELGPRVLLTGEYGPDNLLLKQLSGGDWQLGGMLDFADSMIGPARYDWVGPLCFLVQGARPRLEAFLGGYGIEPDTLAAHEAQWRREQLSLLLLHRYSHPAEQIRLPGWQSAPDLEALSHLLWPGQD